MSSPVELAADKSDQPKRKRGWRQRCRFSLWAIRILTTRIATWLGWWLHNARQQREAVAELRKVGAAVEYDFQSQKLDSPSYWPTWFVDLLGVDCFANVISVSLVNTPVTDAGLEDLKGLTSLIYLDLSVTPVTGAGVAELQKSLPKCNIHYSPNHSTPRVAPERRLPGQPAGNAATNVIKPSIEARPTKRVPC